MRPEDFTRQIEQFKARHGKLETELSDPGVYAVPARAAMLAHENRRLDWKTSSPRTTDGPER